MRFSVWIQSIKASNPNDLPNREQTVRIVRFRFGVVFTDGICMNQYCAPQQKNQAKMEKTLLTNAGSCIINIVTQFVGWKFTKGEHTVEKRFAASMMMPMYMRDRMCMYRAAFFSGAFSKQGRSSST